MADDVNILDAAGATVAVASDQVTDSVFGTAQVQFMKALDARDNSSNRQAVTSQSEALVEVRANAAWQDAVLVELRGIRQLLGVLANQPQFLQ